MPFVTDIAGPQRPVQTWPPLAVGVCDAPAPSTPIRPGPGTPTSTCGHETPSAAGDVGWTCSAWSGVRAHLADRVIDDIVADPADDRVAQLAGSRVGPGFRSTVGKLLPDEVARAGLLHLLLDDWVGAALVSGYAVQHTAITLGIEEKLPPGTADQMAGICAGFAQDASLVPYAKRNGTIPSVHGPVAPPLDVDGVHSVEPLAPARHAAVPQDWTSDRERWLRRALPRLARRRRRCRDDRSRVHRRRLDRRIDENHRLGCGDVRVLPWQECPGAIGSAARIQGMTLSEMRDRVRGEFVGTTHVHTPQRHVARGRRSRRAAGPASRTLGLDDV